MDPATLQKLTELALVIGTTSEHLFAVLTKQAMVNALALSFMTLLLGGVTVGCGLFVQRMRWERESAEALAAAGFLLAILSIGCVISLIAAVDSALTAYFNPEYFALAKIGEWLH